jgi:hypothetical protein
MTKPLGVLLTVLTIFSASVCAQQITPVSVHVVTAGQKQQSEFELQHTSGFHWVTFTYTVAAGNLSYLLETRDDRRPEVGQDYTVVKISKDSMDLLIPGKKKPVQVTFQIKSVSETAK